MWIDAGPMSIDAGPMWNDAGPMSIDAGPMFIDAGPRSIDGGVTLIDGGVVVIDGGVAVIDGGVQTIDSGPAGCTAPATGRCRVAPCEAGRCQILCEDGLDFAGARSFCQGWGGGLATIETQAESVCLGTMSARTPSASRRRRTAAIQGRLRSD